MPWRRRKESQSNPGFSWLPRRFEEESPITPLGHCDTTGRGKQEHDLPGRCSNTRSAERRHQVVRAIRPRRSPIGVRLARRLIGSLLAYADAGWRSCRCALTRSSPGRDPPAQWARPRRTDEAPRPRRGTTRRVLLASREVGDALEQLLSARDEALRLVLGDRRPDELHAF